MTYHIYRYLWYSIPPLALSPLYRNRAQIFLNRTNFEAALKDVTFAVENSPNCKRMYELRGDIYGFKGDLNAAVEQLHFSFGTDFTFLTSWF